jgi:septal ring factor EnvC (AmiA/AmiB activator)
MTDRTPEEMRAKASRLVDEARRLDARASALRQEAAAQERHAAGHRLCEAKTKRGRPCRNEARPGRPYCAHHDPDLTPEERCQLLAPRFAGLSSDRTGER